jgi:xanthine dehydrogenase FAD-binding subunit
MFDFKALYEAESVAHAVALMQEHPGARIIAGGSDVLIKLREGKLAGSELISIYGLEELRGVSLDGGGALRILPLTAFSALEDDPLILAKFPVLAQAAGTVGGPQLRNIGTVGGNICNGVTSADTASTLLAWDAVLELTGPEGQRKVPIGSFYLGPGKVDIKPFELLTAICIPRESYEGHHGFYSKYSMREAMDIATTGCSVNVKLSEDLSRIEDVRAAFGVAAPVPIRASYAETLTRGTFVSEETVRDFAEAVLVDIKPRDSWRASKAFREQIAQEMAKRALTECILLARGER